MKLEPTRDHKDESLKFHFLPVLAEGLIAAILNDFMMKTILSIYDYFLLLN
jgi:hypothetical protein